jgi:hypothetical protein
MTPAEHPTTPPTGPGDPGGGGADDRAVADRLEHVEDTLRSLTAQVATRRLVVAGDDDTSAIVMEVVDGQAQVRLSAGRPAPSRAGSAPAPPTPTAMPPAMAAVPAAAANEEPSAAPEHHPPGWSPAVTVVLFACPAQHDLGALAGLQVWSDGDVVTALEAWHDGVGPWRASVSLGEDHGGQPGTGP